MKKIHRHRIWTLFIVGAAIWFQAAAGVAAPIAFTSEAAWLAALPGGSTIATEDFNTDPSGDISSGTNLGLFTVTHDGTTVSPEIDTLFCGSQCFRGDISEIAIGGRATFHEFTFNAPIVGFGGGFFSTANSEILLVDVNGTEFNFSTLLGGSGTGNGFLGIVDLMSPIASIRFTTGDGPSANELWGVDDFQLATAPIPEPSTILLFGTGVLGLIGYARRKRLG